MSMHSVQLSVQICDIVYECAESEREKSRTQFYYISWAALDAHYPILEGKWRNPNLLRLQQRGASPILPSWICRQIDKSAFPLAGCKSSNSGNEGGRDKDLMDDISMIN